MQSAKISLLFTQRLPVHIPPKRLLLALAFVVTYVLLDWASYFHPMYGLNITPWNPSLALGLVYWFRVGRWAALPWFSAILAGEALVRGMPASIEMTLALSLALTTGYGAIAVALRRYMAGDILHDRRQLLSWLSIVVVGTLATSSLYVSLLRVAGLIPVGDWAVALARFWVGDCVGIIVTMPFFWLLLEERERVFHCLFKWETACYVALGVAMLWVAFGLGGSGEFQYFYLLFFSIVWAAARQGVTGAAIAAFAVQAGIIFMVQWQQLIAVTVFELQMLGAALASVGLFIGVVVDEKERVSDELRQTLRLAAAGEMAGALAHELNQPLMALSAYGSACERLMQQGDPEKRLSETIRRMVAECFRAADVVRRLRDFFRTGATQLERVELDALLRSAVAPFETKAHHQNVHMQLLKSPPCQLMVDRLQIEVVLRNLLSNAFDAVADQASGKREIWIEPVALDTDWVSVRVRDSGPGLSETRIKRLFEAFHSSKSQGLGLGLVISKAIVEAHGGTLWADAASNGIFTFKLPREGNTADGTE